MDGYHYTESGLDNVVVYGVAPCLDDDGDEVVTIPNIGDLHRTISKAIFPKQ